VPAKEFATLAAQMQVDPATLGIAWAAYHPSVSCKERDLI